LAPAVSADLRKAIQQIERRLNTHDQQIQVAFAALKGILQAKTPAPVVQIPVKEYTPDERKKMGFGKEVKKEVIKVLAERLAKEFGDGFSDRNLAYMRTFYLQYRERLPILQTASAKSSSQRKSQTSARCRPTSITSTAS
jgi:hypothetical protein